MLTIIGLFPAVFALNPETVRALEDLPNIARQVEPLIEKYGDDQKSDALNAAKALEDYKAEPPASASLSDILRLKDGQDGRLGVASETAKERSGVRDNVYKLIAQLKHAEEVKGISEEDKSKAKSLAKHPSSTLLGGCGSSARFASASVR
jgi:inorganic phosphate transporter, PiT family